MEMQSKPGPNGTPGIFPSPSPGATVTMPANSTRLLGMILRGLAVILTLLATIIMGASKQTKNDVQQYDATTDTLYLYSATIKSTYFSPYIYFIAANALAFFFSAISFALMVINRSSFGSLPLLSIIDIVTFAFLFSSNGAAAAVALIGKNGTKVATSGSDEVWWIKYCDNAGKFCSMVTAAIVLSMFASVAYFLLLVVTVVGLHTRSRT